MYIAITLYANVVYLNADFTCLDFLSLLELSKGRYCFQFVHYNYMVVDQSVYKRCIILENLVIISDVRRSQIHLHFHIVMD